MLRRWEPLEPLAYLHEYRSSRHVFLGRVTVDDSNINRLLGITVGGTDPGSAYGSDARDLLARVEMHARSNTCMARNHGNHCRA